MLSLIHILEDHPRARELFQHGYDNAKVSGELWGRTAASAYTCLLYTSMRTARTYLLRDHMSTSEIAKRLAYHDVYHFIRSFEQFFGVHPDRYLQAQSPQDTLIPVRAPF